MRLSARLILALGLSGALAACAGPMASRDSGPVEVGIVGINDFHGSLEPPRQAVNVADGKGGVIPVPAGGAAWLASAIDSIRAAHPQSLTVSAGDMISASQLASSLYLDEPAIGVMNRIGVDFNAVGNHEFDRGQDELLRMQNGGCARFTAKQPCALEPFTGAKFRYLSASTVKADGTTLFPATGLRTFGKGRRAVTVGVIGLTLKGTPNLVNPTGIAGLTFADEADTINAAVPKLKEQGADAIVVLIHEGGRTKGEPDPQGCTDFAGDIRPILDRLDTRVDVVVSGHTHWAYVCDYAALNPAKPFLLTSAGVYGELVTDITLKIDPLVGRVVSKAAKNVIVQSVPYTSSRGPLANTPLFPQFQPRPDVAGYVAKYVEASKQYTQRPIGKIDRAAPKNEGAEGGAGGPLGNLIADAQLGATRDKGAQIAFMNPFGIRAPLVPTADGTLTFGDIYLCQPFGNNVVTETMTGAQIKAALEEGLDDTGPKQVLAPSTGFAFTYDPARPSGDRIVSITLDGQPLDMAKGYRVTVNGFLGLGGDGFSGFTGKPETVTGPTDIDALESWISVVPVRSVPQEMRAARVG
ncbi:bifunctional metallophosphatase/5'-nucleotidase [Novosphingobium sp. MMS21-SN21R]|uniref:bifunctional metallophosphatase/5'-nucleotidase n=1 Tax=Novosphingobium sp. MMS21-SN21R TaxID=2969298 RepID=UPI002885499B|nr:bifunctional metallophosphatase/5'-nucleotidase [Novosphingobium sp. MMS21-SN21R]MDT0509246.1 bifunctional metallophosphatase/5'-nucleotidase [Novosphingobium sp. MMS21-SN21R]